MKIADFGLARGVHQIDYYKKTTNVSGSDSIFSGITFLSCNFPVENFVFQQLTSRVERSVITALLLIFRS